MELVEVDPKYVKTQLLLAPLILHLRSNVKANLHGEPNERESHSRWSQLPFE